MFLCDPKRFTEPLEMHHLPHTQKTKRICHIRIFHKTEQIIIRCAGFLLCCNHIRTTFD